MSYLLALRWSMIVCRRALHIDAGKSTKPAVAWPIFLCMSSISPYDIHANTLSSSPTETSASSHTNKAITVALPIVLSLVGVAAIIGVSPFLYRRNLNANYKLRASLSL